MAFMCTVNQVTKTLCYFLCFVLNLKHLQLIVTSNYYTFQPLTHTRLFVVTYQVLKSELQCRD